ncbi:hypothetical protein AAFF_G00361220 [Aldrovandia affinis]|uniref:Uncharacterized protein n=1 Tax=Aldrovandia affinis TaxID=143900 RepID=A0AAD7R5B6_9TELE|nr:hypothetical protein AAFF_G00361220 [Aldrovandia affinis]
MESQRQLHVTMVIIHPSGAACNRFEGEEPSAGHLGRPILLCGTTSPMLIPLLPHQGTFPKTLSANHNDASRPPRLIRPVLSLCPEEEEFSCRTLRSNRHLTHEIPERGDPL